MSRLVKEAMMAESSMTGGEPTAQDRVEHGLSPGLAERVADGDPTTSAERQMMHDWRIIKIKPAEAHWRPQWDKAKLAYAFYDGNQYSEITKDGVLVENTPSADYGEGLVSRTTNHFATLADNIVAKMLSDRAQPIPIAGRGGGGHTQNAKAASAAKTTMLHIAEINHLEQEDQRLALLAYLGSRAFQKSWPDETRQGRQRVKLPDDGGTEIQEGTTTEIMYITVRDDEIIHQPGRWRFATWAAHVYRRSISTLKKEYDNAQFIVVKDRSVREFDLEDSSRGNPAPRFNADPQKDPDGQEVDVYECYFQEANAKTGATQWNKWIFSEDTVLVQPERISHNPLTPVYFNEGVSKDGFANTLAWDLFDLQRELNQTLSGLARLRRKNQNPKLVIPEEYSGEIEIDNSSDPLLVPSDENGNPINLYYLVPPPFDSQGHSNHINMIKGEMEDRAGIHDTTRGLTQSNITSGKQAQIATGQDTINSQRFRSLFREGKEEHWLKVLQMAEEFFSHGKLLEIVGDQNECEVEEFKKGLLDDITAVRMQTISRIPMEPAQLQAFILQLVDKGLFLEENEAALDKVLEHMDFARTAQQKVDTIKMSKCQADKEHEALDLGVETSVGARENHLIHIEEHQLRMTRPDYKKLPDLVRIGYEEHIVTHEVKMSLLVELQAARQANLNNIVNPQQAEEVA